MTEIMPVPRKIANYCFPSRGHSRSLFVLRVKGLTNLAHSLREVRQVAPRSPYPTSPTQLAEAPAYLSSVKRKTPSWVFLHFAGKRT